jgi:hypothetical protein
MNKLAFLTGALLMASTALAHHSNAEYDRSALRELEGELIAVHWANPHVMFRVRAPGEGGALQDWELGGLPILLLEKAGLAKDLFAVGASVRVAGWASRRRSAMLVSSILLPSGEEALFYPQSRLRWSDRSAGGQWSREAAAPDERGIYRIWSVADLGAYMRAAQAIVVKLTPAAQSKIRASSAEIDQCRPQGMPGLMLNPLPIQFIDRGDHIDLQLTTFGVLRRIEMSYRRDFAAVPLSDLGYSQGRWIGDTLEVRTTRVGWPYVDDELRPQSENVAIVERFSLVEEGRLLRYTQTVTDPSVLAEPMTVGWDLVDAGDTSIGRVACE